MGLSNRLVGGVVNVILFIITGLFARFMIRNSLFRIEVIQLSGSNVLPVRRTVI